VRGLFQIDVAQTTQKCGHGAVVMKGKFEPLPKAYKDSIALSVVAAWSVSMIWLSANSGIQHDYRSYLQQWALVMDGADPWSTTNAYGPLHNLLAFLLPLGALAPKLFMSTALLVGNILLIREFCRDNLPLSDYSMYIVSVTTNVLIINMAFAYGSNDALVAALLVSALVARHRGHLATAGCLLGLAALLKYYPALLIPFFGLENGRFQPRLLSTAASTIAIGLVAAMFVWGGNFFTAISFGAERDPKLLSVLSALSSHSWLIRGAAPLAFLVHVNFLFVLVVSALFAFLSARLSLHWLEASVVAYLAILTTYKVGNQQFYVPWLFLVAALPLADTASARRLAFLCLPFVLFLSVFQWGYAYASDNYNQVLGVVRQEVGFVAFTLSATTLAAYFWTLNRNSGLNAALVPYDKVSS
jgi:Glycosyltransferase family 87